MAEPAPPILTAPFGRGESLIVRRRGILGLVGGLVAAPAILTLPIMRLSVPKLEVPLVAVTITDSRGRRRRYVQKIKEADQRGNGLARGKIALPYGEIPVGAWDARMTVELPGLGEVGSSKASGYVGMAGGVRHNFEWTVQL